MCKAKSKVEAGEKIHECINYMYDGLVRAEPDDKNRCQLFQIHCSCPLLNANFQFTSQEIHTLHSYTFKSRFYYEQNNICATSQIPKEPIIGLLLLYDLLLNRYLYSFHERISTIILNFYKGGPISDGIFIYFPSSQKCKKSLFITFLTYGKS